MEYLEIIEIRLRSSAIRKEGSDCWFWQKHKDRDGYGRIKFRGEMSLAHRVSYLIHRGPIPTGKCVLHKCDTPDCVNPNHLFIGTQADNMADMHNKGRGNMKHLNKGWPPHAAALQAAREGKS